MARKRKKILGLSVGPPVPPSRLETAGKVAAVGVGAATLTLGARKLARRIGTGGRSTRVPEGTTARRPERSDHSVNGAASTISAVAHSPEARARAQRASLQARAARADVQRRLKAGEMDIGDVFDLADRDDAISRTRVKILLQNLPGIGATGAMKAMEEMGIDPSRRIRGLGNQQRAQLAERFSD